MNEVHDKCLAWIRRTGVGMVIASLAFGAAFALWGVIAGGYDNDSEPRLLATPMISFIAGALVIVTTASLRKRRIVSLLWCNLLLTLLTTAYWLIWLWTFDTYDRDPFHLQALGSLSAIVLCLTIAGQLLIADAKSLIALIYCRALAIWVMGYAALIVAFIWSAWMQRRGDFIGPPTAIAGLATVGMLLVARVMLAPRMKKPPKESLGAKPRLRLNCPRCSVEQTHAAGLVRCPDCRFVMLIEIEEPRCACGYLLYQLTGDTCPECGRAIDSSSDNPPRARTA